MRVITKGRLVHLSRPVQKLYPLEFRSEGEGTPTNSVCKRSKETPTRNQGLEGYFRDPGFDQNTVRDSGKRKIF